MTRTTPRRIASALMLAGALGAGSPAPAQIAAAPPSVAVFPDPSGAFATVNLAGAIDTRNPFFLDLGTNGRRCVTCHQPSDAWTVTPRHLRERFEQSAGTDPIFRPNDGAACPDMNVATLAARRSAYGLLLRKGLIRVEMAVPANAEFSVIAVDNPYGCSSSAALSVYRRPLPTTSLPFLSTVMWDGRETAKGKPVYDDLRQQALDATLGHAQAAVPPTSAQLQAIVDFELQLFSAQQRDADAGRLDAAGASGGPLALSRQDFFLGINDPLGLNPSGAAFSPVIFTLFDAWSVDTGREDRDAARRSIARGQALFNGLPIDISGVAGLNDVPLPADGQVHPVIRGTCGTCHDSPNVGDHSLPAPLNIGIADPVRRTADLPLITLMNNATGAVVQTTDPGRALVTGKWSDVGKFKGPILRALAARAPYFHNGSAATLADVVDFYDTRFGLRLSDRDKADLVAFLGAL